MFSILKQEKTSLRDPQGITVYRRLYLCDAIGDVSRLPVGDAPGSVAVVAGEGGRAWLLDHQRVWHPADVGAGMGGVLWSI